jgi:Spy/CpxP family protein refolding chaperone
MTIGTERVPSIRDEPQMHAGGGHMKAQRILASAALVVMLLPAAVSAQMGHRGPNNQWCLPSDFTSTARLELTGEQQAAIESIEKSYAGQANDLQSKLMSKRLELQSLFRDVEADKNTIRAKAREVFELQNHYQQLTIDYQLEVRGVLTHQQLKLWYQTMDLGPRHRWGRRP